MTTALRCNIAFQEVGNARTVLGYVMEQVQRNALNPAILDHSPNWIPSKSIVEFFSAGELANEEWKQYKQALTTGGGDINAEQHAVLRSLLLWTIAKLPTRHVKQVQALSDFSAISTDTTEKTLKELAAAHVISYDDATSKYSFFPPGGGNTKALEAIRQRKQGRSLTWPDVITLNRTYAAEWGFTAMENNVPWSAASDWGSEQVLLPREFCKADKLRAAIQDTSLPGAIFWLCAKTDGDLISLQGTVQAVLDEVTGNPPKPFILVLPSKPSPVLYDKLLDQIIISPRMKGPENKLLQLTRLLETGTVARSACSRELLTTLVPLLDSGVVTEAKSGAGRRLVVRNPQALRDFIQHHFPNAPVLAGTSSRVAGVSRFRDTKSVASDLPEIVTVRAWDDAALQCHGKSVAAVAATSAHGVFSFLLTDHHRPILHGPCALVENPAVFTQFEHLRLPSRLALYGHGRASHRLLDWLASQTAPDFQLLHLPDYDPVGLDEFTRLQARLGSRVQLHLPENLAALFARHSNRELLQKPSTQSRLARLRSHADHAVRTVLKLIEQHNAGLEQEALLISQSSPDSHSP